MSTAIAVDELSLSERRAFRAKALAAAIDQALALSLATSAEGLIHRGILPATDLGAPAGSGYSNEVFVTGAAVVNTWTSVYDTLAVAQLGSRKVLVIYKVVNMTAMPSITAVRFRLGLTGVTTFGVFDLECIIDTQLTPEVYLSEPIVYSKDQYANIDCYARVAIPVGERLGFVGFVVEPVGESVS